jgi:hypothetical protein
MSRLRIFYTLLILGCSVILHAGGDDPVYPGADERSPSRSEYFSWINNTNEGATEVQTLINLDFFQWLKEEYGMHLDIYAFDAGAVDGKRFYGHTDSPRFRRQFPSGFGPIYRKASRLGIRLGIWGGPDGFGDTPEEEAARIEQMVGLCRDYGFALFKFDAVCGPLRREKEGAFIHMMTLCRRHSPDLILLNHRLGFEKAQAHATTFLWEGKETYIDVFSTNNVTAPHHRAEAISRGLVPGLKRLTEDHGVCLSSCLDFWEDDLILQTFNRNLILSPQLYGNPWLLRDEEYPRLARIFNLHRKYRAILIEGKVLPESKCGPSAVSRGNASTRLITLRNLTWQPVTYRLNLDASIGLTATGTIHCRRLFPGERMIGEFKNGDPVSIEVSPFRACLILATTAPGGETGILGADYEVVRDMPGKSVQIRILGMPGTESRISLSGPAGAYRSALLDGRPAPALIEGGTVTLGFAGEQIKGPYHRKLADMGLCDIPRDAETLYEATAFATDSNALEVRSLIRSGASRIPEVKRAREAFFNQRVFRDRGIWDRNLLDGDPASGFWPSRKYGIDQRVKGGCLRLDLGRVTDVDEIVLHTPDDYSLQPLRTAEGNHVEISTDLQTWTRLTYLAGKEMRIKIPQPTRFLRFAVFADRLTEIEGFKNSAPLPRTGWRVSNLLAHPRRLQPLRAWHARITLEQYVKGSKLCIAVEGVHGVEGAYAALKVDGVPRGCPDRAVSFPSNTWEYVNARRDRNYTYYAPVTRDMTGVPIDVYVLGYQAENLNLNPRVWVTAHPEPRVPVMLALERE